MQIIVQNEISLHQYFNKIMMCYQIGRNIRGNSLCLTILYTLRVKERLKSSRRKLFGRFLELVDRHEIPISQMTTDIFSLSSLQFFSNTDCDLHRL